jgi:histone-lysine N-methyltransferase SETMAR
MLFQYHMKKKATEATEDICKIYGDILDVRKCQRWFKKFKSGDLCLENEPRSGRPVQAGEAALKSAIEDDPMLTIEKLSDIVGTSWSSTQRILKKLGKVQKEGVWVPHLLTDRNMAERLNISRFLQEKEQLHPFLCDLVTGDEKWVFYSNVTKKKQWLNRGQKAVSTPKRSLYSKKVLLCVWWDSKGIIYFELLRQGQTVSAEMYCQQLDRLNAALHQKRPALVNRRTITFQHDNARPHVAKSTREKLQDLGWATLLHPPYSPDLAPSDYHLFRSLEHYIRHQNFNSIEEVKTALSDYFQSKPTEFYKKGIDDLKERWQKVIDNVGNYFV